MSLRGRGEDIVLHPSYLDRAQQEALLADIAAVIAQAPLYVPRALV